MDMDTQCMKGVRPPLRRSEQLLYYPFYITFFYIGQLTGRLLYWASLYTNEILHILVTMSQIFQVEENMSSRLHELKPT